MYVHEDQVALAIVLACEHTGENPLAIETSHRMKARWVAFAALRQAFPERHIGAMARSVGYQGDDPWSRLCSARNRPGWPKDVVDRIALALRPARPELAPKNPMVPVGTKEPLPGFVPRSAPGRILGDLGIAASPPAPRSRFSFADGPPVESKKPLYDLLAEAAANTAKMQEQAK